MTPEATASCRLDGETRVIEVQLPVQHDLKCWPEYFNEVASGRKTWELRKDDRSPQFTEGDLLRLWEYDPVSDEFPGRLLLVRVGYVARGRLIPEGFCVMSIKLVENGMDGDATAEILRLKKALVTQSGEREDCGQDVVCMFSPGCDRHWIERNSELVAERDEMQEELSKHRNARELVAQYIKQQESSELADLDPGDLPETQLIDICNSLRELTETAYQQGHYDAQMANGPRLVPENARLKKELAHRDELSRIAPPEMRWVPVEEVTVATSGMYFVRNDLAINFHDRGMSECEYTEGRWWLDTVSHVLFLGPNPVRVPEAE